MNFIQEYEEWQRRFSPTFKRLENMDRLEYLAGRFRFTKDLEERRQIATEYAKVTEDIIRENPAEGPDMTALLPDDWMPAEWKAWLRGETST